MTRPDADRGLSLLDWATAVSTLAIAGLALASWLYAPEGPVPLHFGIDGLPDRWGDKTEAVGAIALFAALNAGVGFVFAWLARDRASGESIRRAGPAFPLGRAVAIATLTLVSAMLAGFMFGVLDPQGDPLAQQRVITAVLAGVSLVLGAFLGKAGPNPVVGVRTYWAMNSRLAWDKANRLTGRVWFWTGLTGLAAAPLGPQPATVGFVIVALIAGLALGVFESWRVWRDDPERAGA